MGYFNTPFTRHQKRSRCQETVTGDAREESYKLVALYILTTEVPCKHALDGFGLKHSTVYTYINQIKARLQELLADYAPPQNRRWQDRLEAGEVAPYLQIIEKYKDTPQALRAIYTLTTSAKILDVALEAGERSMLLYYRKKCNREFARAYRQAV